MHYDQLDPMKRLIQISLIVNIVSVFIGLCYALIQDVSIPIISEEYMSGEWLRFPVFLFLQYMVQLVLHIVLACISLRQLQERRRISMFLFLAAIALYFVILPEMSSMLGFADLRFYQGTTVTLYSNWLSGLHVIHSWLNQGWVLLLAAFSIAVYYQYLSSPHLSGYGGETFNPIALLMRVCLVGEIVAAGFIFLITVLQCILLFGQPGVISRLFYTRFGYTLLFACFFSLYFFASRCMKNRRPVKPVVLVSAAVYMFHYILSTFMTLARNQKDFSGAATIDADSLLSLTENMIQGSHPYSRWLFLLFIITLCLYWYHQWIEQRYQRR